ncbi:MAG: FAD-linked oxidase C-terminal domain-containing protein [Elusimicrobiota bacterium]|jgi:glycolate oxidase subunit GlcD
MRDCSSLKKLLPGRAFDGEADLLTYSYDAALERARPDAVVLAESVEDVRAAVRWCSENRVPYVARGAGTNLSGGCAPLRGGVVVSTARLKRIVSVDTREGSVVVEPGVVNLDLQKRLEACGWFYAPDPASYKVCTLGGNLGENAGGPRCLKYGVTTNHLRALDVVMPDGALEHLDLKDPGLELASLLCGSEGTLGVITKAWLDITPMPTSIATLLVAFKSLEDAMACVAGTIAAGVLPRVMEAMDRLTVDSIEAYVPAGYPRAEAVLLIELEGAGRVLEAELEKVSELCRRHGATEMRTAKDEAERERLWEGRRSAYAALARLAPNVSVEDGVVPRSRLPEAARRTREICASYKAEAGLLFHAGDGNLHPNVIFDERDRAQTERVRRAGREVLRACVELGGSISGEHGIGAEKRAAMTWLFSPETLTLFRRVKEALDPEGLANPDKLLPLPGEVLEGEPRPKARPLSPAAQALVDAVRERVRAKRPFSVFGSRTRLPGEVAAVHKAGALTTRGLDAVLELERADFVAVVEAGIPVRELRRRLEAEGLYAPLPEDGGTLGGALMTKAHPPLRDALLGLRVLLADGSVCELGAKVVKNVAGYDVPRLLLGSWGTLAVVLEVTLKLSAIRPLGPAAAEAPRPPRMGSWHRRLKHGLDPHALLNPWYAQRYG